MPNINRTRLISLAAHEFQRTAESGRTVPAERNFKGLRINLAQFDDGWDRKRGAAVRLSAVLVQEDDTALERRVCENERATRTYADAATWLQRESAYLRKMARLLDTAGDRLAAVLTRCERATAAE
jgi:hypothetical protein